MREKSDKLKPDNKILLLQLRQLFIKMNKQNEAKLINDRLNNLNK